jgi:hypothetical protein
MAVGADYGVAHRPDVQHIGRRENRLGAKDRAGTQYCGEQAKPKKTVAAISRMFHAFTS